MNLGEVLEFFGFGRILINEQLELGVFGQVFVIVVVLFDHLRNLEVDHQVIEEFDGTLFFLR
jgi:hypothetical protein